MTLPQRPPWTLWWVDAACVMLRNEVLSSVAVSVLTCVLWYTRITQWQRVEQLLGSVPLDVLAAAALRVGANARALMYYEGHVRAAEGGALNPAALESVQYSDEHVSFLQVLFFS